MSVEEFQLIVEKIRPFTNYIYLHVLGEPLLHPQLHNIINIAEKANLNINISTNGGLLERKKEILLNHRIRQINLSLHDAEENISPDKWEEYLRTTLDFACMAAPSTYICLRLWNTTNTASSEFNTFCLRRIANKFGLNPENLTNSSNQNGIKLSEHIFLQHAPRFEWPDDKNERKLTRKNCYALRDHIAILADGQVVPCCLDANASILLGNIFVQELDEILQTNRAKDIKKGFEQRKVIESLCATCGFKIN